jgi:isopenicillin-N N-acyltransferase-like protein
VFPLVEVRGTPYEIGFQHGQAAGKKIDNTIRLYKFVFKNLWGVEWEAAVKDSSRFVKYVQDYDTDLVEEMQGVADGADKSFEEILTVNARSEVIFSGHTLEGCTSIVLTPEVTASKETIIGQNSDWFTMQKESIIILKIKQEKKPNILMITEAGVIGKMGFNSSGLGVCLNGLGSDYKPNGVPIHLVFRGVLNARTLNGAITAVSTARIACPGNFLVAHGNGEAIDIEATPEDFDVLYPQKGLLCHTNHFLSKRFLSIKDTGKVMFPDTFIRLGRANKLLNSYSPQIGIKDLQYVFRDHSNYPNSICRHENCQDDHSTRMATIFSVIMNLDRQQMYVSFGPPCESAYSLFGL